MKIARQVADETGTLMAGNICNTTIYKPNDKRSEEKIRDLFKVFVQGHGYSFRVGTMLQGHVNRFNVRVIHSIKVRAMCSRSNHAFKIGMICSKL